MKVGDLVVSTYSHREGFVGIIVGYDEDDDPIVLWNKHDPADVDEEWAGHYALPEYRSGIKVINASR